MVTSLLPIRPGEQRNHRHRNHRRRQVDRPRRRRRARLDRSRHRHRDHLRQGDRVRRPPAGDEGRAAEHPLARLRADRGGRLLHLHLRADRLLPLGSPVDLVGDIGTSSSPRPRRRSGGSFLVSPALGLMFWTLLAFGVTMYVLSKLAFPRIGEALEKRANAIRDNIAESERVREEADELLARVPQAPHRGARAGGRHRRPCPQRGRQPQDRGDRGGQGQARGARRRGAQGHRGRDAALARADPQGGRRPDRARDRARDPQDARRRRPQAARRRGARRGRLLDPGGRRKWKLGGAH